MSDIEARLARLEDYLKRIKQEGEHLDDRIGKAEQDLRIIAGGRPS
jgi:phosphopantetheine adenylyltransferase